MVWEQMVDADKTPKAADNPIPIGLGHPRGSTQEEHWLS